jgi:hypothetical protein
MYRTGLADATASFPRAEYSKKVLNCTCRRRFSHLRKAAGHV